MEANPGDIVYSKAGRDKSRYFILISTHGEYAYICDGQKRKVDKAKKKKIKHLKTGIGHSDFIENKLKNNEKITNAEVRRELREYNMDLMKGSVDVGKG